VNLERLLMQSVVGEATFSKVGTAPPNMMLSTETRTSAESESKLPEVLFICQRPSSYSATLSCCTPLSATKETFEVLDSDETEDGPLKRSVKWRVERRFGEPIICSTFIASRQELQRPGLVPEFLVPETPEAKVTIDNYISNKWKRIRKNLDVPLDDAIPDSPLIVIARERTGGFTSIPSMAMEPERDFIVLDQDMDFENSPWGRPVHWRIGQRGDQEVYCSKMIMTAEEILAALILIHAIQFVDSTGQVCAPGSRAQLRRRDEIRQFQRGAVPCTQCPFVYVCSGDCPTKSGGKTRPSQDVHIT